jgi:hypothetical protein
MSEGRDPRENPRPGDVLLRRRKRDKDIRRQVNSNSGGLIHYHQKTDDGETVFGICPLYSWCSWATRTEVVTVGDYDGPDRDPRIMPVNGDVLRLPDCKKKECSVRQVLGTTKMSLNGKERVEVQYRLLHLGRTPMHSCNIQAWRRWASLAIEQ